MLPFRKAVLPNAFVTVIPLSFFTVVISFMFGAPWVAPGYILFGVLFNWYLSSRDDQELEKRASQPASPPWSVTVDGVSVGTLSDAQYAGLLLSARRDRQTALREVRRLIHAVATFAGKTLLFVPLVLFWAAVLMSLTRPHLYEDMTHLFVAKGPAAFLWWIGAAFLSGVVGQLFIIVLGFIAVMLIARPSAYDRFMHRLVRQRLGLTADGHITLLWESPEPPPFESGCGSRAQKFRSIG